MIKKTYVCGFLFDEQMDRVVLVLKNRPEWQKDRMNGVGGKVESGEPPHRAMMREFKEETGMDVPEWQHFMKIGGEDWEVYFYWATVAGDAIESAETVTDEPILVVDVHDIHRLPLIDNLRWLIPMCADRMHRNGFALSR